MNIGNLLKGWGYSPLTVGVVRGAIGAAVAAAAGALVVSLTTADWGQYAPFSPIVLLVLRTIEAQFDQQIDPAQNVTAERRAANPPNPPQ